VIIILSTPGQKVQAVSDLQGTINSILTQSVPPGHINAIGDKFDNADPSIQFLSTRDFSYGTAINEAVNRSDDALILYIDNRTSPVRLSTSAIELFSMAMKRNPEAAMIYGDYNLENENGTQDIHLLNHHAGRVRDNQDYGRVFCIRKSSFLKCGGVDDAILYNPLYDLRLKLSEHGELVRIANKYSGSLYTVISSKEEANVFDYLMEEKESQLEAERICTEHLKRIEAYLPPGEYYRKRPDPKHNPTLKASVIIPVNNRPEFIGMALESCFQQTEQNIEIIIVVNGGDKDSTIPEVNKYMPGGSKYNEDMPKVRLIVVDINNIGFCLNSGVEAAQGEYYVQLDSDDRLKPNAIEDILKGFDSHDDIGMVIGSYDVWEQQEDSSLERKAEIPTVTHDEWTEENGRNNLLRIGGAGAPRSIAIQVIKDIGYFGMNDDHHARNYAEDYEMVLRISEQYRIGRIYNAIYDVIRHPGGTDHSIDQDTIDRNDEAKDHMRLMTIRRRQDMNKSS